MRVSTLPVNGGEKAVVRILDHDTAPEDLGELGMAAADLRRIRRLLSSHEGVILAAGPTGSGKSTTLFAALSELDREHQNVVTLEDPEQAVLVQYMGQFDNEYQFECERRFPGRFASVVLVDAQNPGATDELERLAQQGARGVRLQPNTRSPGSDPLAIWRKVFPSSLDSCGVSTAVGSSRINVSAPRYSSFKISTRCCSPTESCQM